MPWIHMTAAVNGAESCETWLSYSRSINAMRFGRMVCYDDCRSGVRYEYDPQKKKLYRLSMSDRSVAGVRFGARVVSGDLSRRCHSREMFSGTASSTAAADGDRTRPALDHVRTGVSNPHRSNRRSETTPISMVIRVDPEKMLPELNDRHRREG